MLDYVADGPTPEAPESAVNQQYMQTPPAPKTELDAWTGSEDTSGFLSRFAQRTIAAASSMLQGEDKMPADEVNKRYAPTGPDGKPVKITDTPMYDNVAQLVSQAKSAELDREGALSRAQAQRSGLGNFTMGVSAFLRDPLNVAAMFVPGVGEEAAAGAVGRLGLEGLAAKTGSRFIVGGTAGAAGQVPLSALRYGLGQQEASDYDLRSAFKDIAFGAAGGAVLHAGFGAIGDGWKAVRGAGEKANPTGEMAGEASKILDADAPTKSDAMDSAVSQVVTGRPVDVDGIFYKDNIDINDYAESQKQLYREGYAPGLTQGELEKSTNDMFGEKEEETPSAKLLPKEEALVAPEERKSIFDHQNGEREAPSDNYTKKLSAYTPYIFRESESSAAREFMPGGGVIAEPGEPHFADNADMALGQKENAGGVLQAFETKNIQGRRNTNKPGLEHTFKQGMGEYTGRYNKQSDYQRALVAMRIRDGLPLSKTEKIILNRTLTNLEKNGWRKTKQEGYTEYERPPSNAEVTPETAKLAQDAGVDTAGKTHEQVWDEVAEKKSIEEQEKMGTDIEANAKAALEEALLKERQARGAGLLKGEPIPKPEEIDNRSLEELEHERQQEIASRAAQAGAEPGGQRGVAGGAGVGAEGVQHSGGGVEPAGRTGPQGAAKPASDSAGANGRIATPHDAEIATLESKLNVRSMTGEEQGLIAQASKAAEDAQKYGKGYQAAAECLAEEGV